MKLINEYRFIAHSAAGQRVVRSQFGLSAWVQFMWASREGLVEWT